MRFLKFFVIGIVLGALVWLGVFYTLLGTPGDSTGGLYSAYQYKKQVAERTASPRIVFVGGSGVLLGIGADLIHEALKVPTVNFGIFAGFDLDYQLQLLKPLLREGDIVVLTFEYSAYCFSGAMSSDTRNYIIERDANFFMKQPRWVQLRQVFTLGPGRMVQLGMSAMLPTIERQRLYPIERLNAFGDQMINREEAPKLREIKRYKALDVSQSCRGPSASWSILDQFSESMRKEKNVALLATFPNTIDFQDYKKADFRNFTEKITAFYQTENIEVLGSSQEFMYPIDFFYDTSYHLNGKGVKVRSERLSELLGQTSVVQSAQRYWREHSPTPQKTSIKDKE
ncbi:MAG: hypothetical protein ACFCU8_04245 [Thermosynechococcaceae cyanobacterium]